MNKRIKARWIKALTSGRYEQARKRLKMPDADKFCCLGVLCDLYRKSVGGRWNGDQFVDATGRTMTGVPTDAVVAWAEIPDDNPTAGVTKTLAELNDEGETFEYIAKRIEKYL